MQVKTIPQEAADLSNEQPHPITQDAGGPWYLKATEEPVKPFLALAADHTDEDEEPLSEAVTLYGDIEQIVDRRIATHAKRRAALERSRGRSAIADALDALAEEARGE